MEKSYRSLISKNYFGLIFKRAVEDRDRKKEHFLLLNSFFVGFLCFLLINCGLNTSSFTC